MARKAAIRATVQQWGLGSADIDPAETLLRLLSTAVARAMMYATELERMTAEHGLAATIVGKAVVVDDHGGTRELREYVRGLAEMEARERRMAADVAAKAVAAGLATRQVEVAERVGAQIAEVLRAVLGDSTLGLSEQQRAAVPALLRRHLQIAPAIAAGGVS